MKHMTRYFLFGLFVLGVFTACSRQPAQEINDARAAVDSAMAEGAEKYSPAEAAKINDALTEAMNEVRKQDGNYFKDYKKARRMLAKVKEDADTLRAGLAVKKEEARKKAVAAEELAEASVRKAKSDLAKEIKSANTSLDLETLSSSIRGLDDSLTDIKKLIATEDYTAAIEKAGALTEKASGTPERSGEDSGKSSLSKTNNIE
jgi:hypothetical protein